MLNKHPQTMKILALLPLLAIAAVGLNAASAQTLLVDFGPQFTISGTNGGSNGPDINGNFWNNVNGPVVTNLVSTANVGTGWNISYTTAATFNPAPGTTWASNGLSGLGNLAINTALADGAFTTGSNVQSFNLTNLATNFTYSITLYGGRDAADTRITLYSVAGAASFSNTLTTSGTGIGGVGTNFNNNTVVTFSNLSPTASGVISVSYSSTTTNFSYLNAMRVVAVPEPSTAALVALGGLALAGLAARRRR